MSEFGSPGVKPVTRHEHCIMGIDPGAKGGIAYYFPSVPGMISVEDMPMIGKQVNGAALASRINQMRPTLAVVEAVHAMPKQGVTSSFNFGHSCGVVHGVLAGQGIPLHLVAPGVWKKHFRLPKDKEAARALAVRLWPSCDGFKRKLDHNRAEAALLARYGAETILKANDIPPDMEYAVRA